MRVMNLHRCLVLLAGASLGMYAMSAAPQMSAPLPAIASVRPDFALSGKQTAEVAIRGRSLAREQAVRVTDCDGKYITVKLNHGPTVTASLPASVLAKPCVLRLAPEGNPASSVPFAVADLQLAALQLPIRDSDQYYTWHGEFNRLYDVDQGSELGIPAGATIVAVSMEGKAKPNFILGKDKVVVERLEPVASPAAMKNGTNAIYLMLRGVREEDVRWGPQDVENFWIGTVSGDGKTILECQYLSEMVLEPSGPLDKP
jgi:hypothetical protein